MAISPTEPPPVAQRPEPVRRLRRRGALVVGFFAAFCLAGVYVADSSLPDNALELPAQDKTAIRTVVPEGWAFFTRDPQEPEMRSWRPGGPRGWTAFSPGVNASPGGFFGASRKPRAFNIELGLVYAAAQRQGARWHPCGPGGTTEPLDAIVGNCLAGAPSVPPVPVVRNETPSPSLCGPVAVSAQEPLPWSWARSGVTEQMPVHVLRLEVTC